MNQIALGAAIPWAVAWIVYLCRRGRIGLPFLIVTPLAMAYGALWAVIPDLPRLFGNGALYRRMAQDPRCDIFFFHYTIDQHESDSSWWVLVFLIMAGSLLYAAWRELRRAEQG